EGKLKYLIIDDLRPRNFVKRHFPRISPKLVFTTGFIKENIEIMFYKDPIEAWELAKGEMK
ncbi:MAG: hypothetical protein ACTSQI_22115, partial [Candidatus Helarchaeota archaeon]